MIVVIKLATELPYKNIRFPNTANSKELGYSLQEDIQPLINLEVTQCQQPQASLDHGHQQLPAEHLPLPQSRLQPGRHLFQDHLRATQQHYLKDSFLKKPMQINSCDDYMIKF